MTVEHGKTGQAGEPSVTRITALLNDAQRALAEAEQLLAEAQDARTAASAADLAARQALIVDAAHEEAAVILAKAHADAARLLEHAIDRPRGGAPEATRVAEQAGPVVDLRDDDASPEPAASDVVPGAADASAPAPPSPSAHAATTTPGAAAPVATAPGVNVPVDTLDPEVRASIAAAADMARRVSGRIERLSRDLHQAPAS